LEVRDGRHLYNLGDRREGLRTLAVLNCHWTSPTKRSRTSKAWYRAPSPDCSSSWIRIRAKSCLAAPSCWCTDRTTKCARSGCKKKVKGRTPHASLRTSRARLSERRPRNAACLRRPSAVHPTNRICATSSASPTASPAPRRPSRRRPSGMTSGSADRRRDIHMVRLQRLEDLATQVRHPACPHLPREPQAGVAW
jgi:hypothetical protein